MSLSKSLRTAPAPSVLLVEDDDAIRAAVEVALGQEGYDVTSFSDGLAVTGGLDPPSPALAVIDVRLQVGPSGFDVARALRSRHGDVAIIFLTAADTVEDRLAGFEAGADDYVVKPFSIAELTARVKALLRRSGAMMSNIYRLGDLVIDDAGRVVTRGDHRVELTETEYQLLYALIRHSGQVLSKVQLLSMVWGFDAYDTNLVEVHMSAVRRKTEAAGPRLIHTVRGAGYVMREAP